MLGTLGPPLCFRSVGPEKAGRLALDEPNRKIDETFGVFPTPVRRFLVPSRPIDTEKPFSPPADVFAKGADLVIHLELPGINPEKDLKITIAEGELVVTGERSMVKEYAEAGYYRVERRFGAFERHFPIPKTIDETVVTAVYERGVLEIALKGAVLVAEARKQQAKVIPVQVKTPALAAKA